MLIVRGPSAIEAATIRAYRLGTPEAICLNLKAPTHQAVSVRALKSLIELGKNPAFSKAIAELIDLIPVDDAPVFEPPVDEQPPQKLKLPAAAAERFRDGFAKCLRTRDGPVVA